MSPFSLLFVKMEGNKCEINCAFVLNCLLLYYCFFQKYKETSTYMVELVLVLGKLINTFGVMPFRSA